MDEKCHRVAGQSHGIEEHDHRLPRRAQAGQRQVRLSSHPINDTFASSVDGVTREGSRLTPDINAPSVVFCSENSCVLCTP